MSKKGLRTRHIPSRRESRRAQLKRAVKPKSKTVTIGQAVQLTVLLGLMIAAGLFGVSASTAKRIHFFAGTIMALDPSAMSIQLRCPEGGEVISLSLTSGTTFVKQGVTGLPDSTWVGRDVEVQFRKSLFFEDIAQRVATK